LGAPRQLPHARLTAAAGVCHGRGGGRPTHVVDALASLFAPRRRPCIAVGDGGRAVNERGRPVVDEARSGSQPVGAAAAAAQLSWFVVVMAHSRIASAAWQRQAESARPGERATPSQLARQCAAEAQG